MDIAVFSNEELPTVMRVLRTALNPTGALASAEHEFLEAYARITGAGLPAELATVTAQEVDLGTAHPKKRLIQLCAMAVLLARPIRPPAVLYLKSLAAQLQTHDPVIDVVDALSKGQRLKARLITLRRMVRVVMKETYLAEGILGVLRLQAAMLLGAPVNRDKLWGYKRLGLLPEGTLGREYWRHMTEVGFGFPGDFKGIADSIAYHDVAHVLAEHDTTPGGEIQQGSFQGGNRREDGFFFVMFVILQFHQDVKITPAAPSAAGHFAPRRVLWAIHRGATCNVDMTHQWNFWPLMSLPIEEARRKIQLLPPLAAA